MTVAIISPATGRAYGIERTCAVFAVPHSSFYAWRSAQRCPERTADRRGPKPMLSDADLLAAIRADLAPSPWHGKGHRKIWPRLRVLDGIRVGRTRILEVMGENKLLSPHRRPNVPPGEHVGRITTDAPDVMWATNATQIPTVEDGKVWLFGVVEHWNGEALGWNVSKRGGDRYTAAEAVGAAVKTVSGHLNASAARGIALRHDHGSNFTADHFQKQIRFWGMTPSYAFVGEPETNGVAERFFRTLKEQIVHGRIFQILEEVCAAVRVFIAQYNASWLLKKNGFLSPSAARAAWNQAILRMAA